MSADDKTQIILPVVGTVPAGTQLSGIYELDNRVASGGMGEVYRGHNIQTGDHVAIKVVLPEYANNQTILSLFRKEASILNRLSHEAIVRYHVFTIDQAIGRPYLAMEFVDGQSLFDVMARGPMSTADICKLCHRLASGLSAVHEAGAVHRDLSPDNIILPGGKVERAKIIDFGIARSATIGGETLIGGSFAGKYNYVSPEQLGLFGGDVKEPSDIYSLGLVLAAAMRGSPIDMGGSQMEIVEKRRSVPDLSDIEQSFRPLIAAMLQPDPADRPASMADIARMTRDGTLVYAETAPKAAAVRHDGRTMLVEADRSPFGQTSPDFVPYIPPAHLSQARPLAGVAPQAAVAQSSRGRNTLLATAAVVAALGAGAYFGDFLTPSDQRMADAETPRIAPESTAAPVADTAASDQPPAQPAAMAPAVPPADQAAGNVEQEKPAIVAPEAATDAGTATAMAEPPSATATLPVEERANSDAAADAESPAAAPLTAAPTPVVEQPAAVEAPQAAVDESAAAPADTTAAAPVDVSQAPAGEPPPVAKQPAAVEASQAPVDQPAAEPADSATATPADAAPAPAAEGPKPVEPESAAVEQPVGEPATPAAQAAAPAPAQQPPDTTAEAAQPDQPAGTKETTVAMNVPAPPATASDSIDGVADRVSWLREYRGGDCFYATVTSATDKAIEIEGFGTSVAPFEQMLEAFQAKFHVEPDVSVRLIEPAQCEITNFLRALNATAAKRPKLALDRTSVPNGAAISGTLETVSGVRGSLLLIDNKGMVFNLDERVHVQSGKAVFSVPISLGAVDQAAGNKVPQLILAITGDVDLKAAELPEPTGATAALSKILAEIQASGSPFSATAKYFRLGG